MKFAIADPPYLGCGASHYGEHHADAADFDKIETHAALVRRLCDEFPDGWAMCLHVPSLRQLLNLCPDDVRVGSWVKSFASFKPNVNPAWAWEPVIFRGGRKLGRDVPTVRDWVRCPITLQTGLTGAKPPEVCWWMFDMLGAERGDELHDLFPGTGAVTRAWDSYRRTLFTETA